MPSIDTSSAKAQPPQTSTINFVNVPERPKNIPYSPINGNVLKLNQYLLNQFNDTAVNLGVSFPEMNAPG